MLKKWILHRHVTLIVMIKKVAGSGETAVAEKRGPEDLERVVIVWI